MPLQPFSTCSHPQPGNQPQQVDRRQPRLPAPSRGTGRGSRRSCRAARNRAAACPADAVATGSGTPPSRSRRPARASRSSPSRCRYSRLSASTADGSVDMTVYPCRTASASSADVLLGDLPRRPQHALRDHRHARFELPLGHVDRDAVVLQHRDQRLGELRRRSSWRTCRRTDSTFSPAPRWGRASRRCVGDCKNGRLLNRGSLRPGRCRASSP